ncbi:PepSY domain-containing protein [Bacillus alveayuensis]|jgi:predicted small secreted protein|uniref:PepSY domain-containing protein n=1 Tax=Aeribacillus alveayuensis TaxID=279215 RepID=UPI0005D12593|nr:PepSY domain-containing protein [Bacillus alveayuensis]
MKWKHFIIGASVGVLVGYVLKERWDKEFISPDKALKNAKKAFQEKGPIDGSWIYTIPQDYEMNGLTYKVYKVGITRKNEEETKQYEVIVDAKTGTILHIDSLSFES